MPKATSYCKPFNADNFLIEVNEKVNHLIGKLFISFFYFFSFFLLYSCIVPTMILSFYFIFSFFSRRLAYKSILWIKVLNQNRRLFLKIHCDYFHRNSLIRLHLLEREKKYSKRFLISLLLINSGGNSYMLTFQAKHISFQLNMALT